MAALEKMFTFLQGRPYRLILFGGRHEVFVDDATKYRNNGQWTDFYFAFEKARELMQADYPPGTEFRMVLSPTPSSIPRPRTGRTWTCPEGADLKAYVVEQTLALIQRDERPALRDPGRRAADGGAKGNPERAPGLILDMVQAANGAQGGALRPERGRLLRRRRRAAEEVRLPRASRRRG